MFLITDAWDTGSLANAFFNKDNYLLGVLFLVSVATIEHSRRNDNLLFIIGAPKTASTSLCGLVNCHPDVFVMCEVYLNNKKLSRWGQRLLRTHPDMQAFFSQSLPDHLEAYRRAQSHLAKAGFAKLIFGDKFVGIESGYRSDFGDTRIIFSVRHLPEWLAKDSVRAEYAFDHDIVPHAVQYTKHFLESFLLERVLHVRLEDFLRDNKQTVASVWKFLHIAKPVGGDTWWQSIGKYPAGDPKNALNWWRGHASSAVAPQGNDTRVELADQPFWKEILPIFDKYYNACKNHKRFAASEVLHDIAQLELLPKSFNVPLEAAYLNFHSQSLNPALKKSATAADGRGKWLNTARNLLRFGN